MGGVGIGCFEEKLVEEVVRMVVEGIYEGEFEWRWEGLRGKGRWERGVKSVEKNLKGGKWLIEGDIKGLFEKIEDNVVIEIMKGRIGEERFVGVIGKLVNGG